MTASASRGGRRARRSTRVSQSLQKARERNAEQLAAQKEREQLVEDNLVEFVDAGEIIAAEHAALEDKLDALRRKIDHVRAESEQRVVGQHSRQAAAAWAIHEHGGRSAAQVAELLELRSEKEARRLIKTGRAGIANRDSCRVRVTGGHEHAPNGENVEPPDTVLPEMWSGAGSPDAAMLDRDASQDGGQRDAG